LHDDSHPLLRKGLIRPPGLRSGEAVVGVVMGIGGGRLTFTAGVAAIMGLDIALTLWRSFFSNAVRMTLNRFWFSGLVVILIKKG
jgi:hypothetical protein